MVHQGILSDIFNKVQRSKLLQQLLPQSVRVVPWLQALAVVSLFGAASDSIRERRNLPDMYAKHFKVTVNT